MERGSRGHSSGSISGLYLSSNSGLGCAYIYHLHTCHKIGSGTYPIDHSYLIDHGPALTERCHCYHKVATVLMLAEKLQVSLGFNVC